MKGRITTVLSLTGVLVAGSAAALVNTQVLQNSTDHTTAAAVSVSDQPDSVSTVTTEAAASPASLPNKLEAAAAVAVTVASTPITTQQAYAIGESGTVVLDTANGALTVVAITPNAGWGVLEHKNTDPLSIEVTFQSATTKVEFKANMLLGVVAVDTESQLLPQPTTASSSEGSTGGSTAGTTGHSTATTDDHDDDSGKHRGGDDDHGDDD